ncbi:hypothetical protein [Alkalibacillus silvisoli]|uniref:DUF4305 domain-containing protein n=1 Tax=Alkalibacillus silvisoli TaxID=392823 RepID=A0ABN0ZYD7_9BACI
MIKSKWLWVFIYGFQFMVLLAGGGWLSSPALITSALLGLGITLLMYTLANLFMLSVALVDVLRKRGS